MFRNRTAWFSSSAGKHAARFWVSQGGVISSWRTADYLFSGDASCPDTERIHASDDYLTDRATVFHSAYLSACQLRQSARSVSLGHYLLPPVCVQREVRTIVGRFIWEQDELLGEVMETHGNRKNEQIETVQLGDGQCAKMKGKSKQEDCMKTPSRDKPACCNGQLYPVNNMLSGFVHIDQLNKYSGELHDFLPSHMGSSVTWKCSRRHPS